MIIVLSLLAAYLLYGCGVVHGASVMNPLEEEWPELSPIQRAGLKFLAATLWPIFVWGNY